MNDGGGGRRHQDGRILGRSGFRDIPLSGPNTLRVDRGAAERDVRLGSEVVVLLRQIHSLRSAGTDTSWQLQRDRKRLGLLGEGLVD